MRYVLLGVSLLLMAAPGWPDEAAYSPDIAEFDGESTFGFAADPAFAFDSAFTIEFWVAAGWQEGIGYDPVVITSGDPQQVEYVVALLEDKDGLVILIDEEEYLVAHDFGNEKLHHVALIGQDRTLGVAINGETIDTFTLPSTQINASSLWVGSFLGQELTFIGSIGQLRLWHTALDTETLKGAALSDISSFEVQHAHLTHLAAMSAFNENALLLVDGISVLQGDTK